MGTVFTVLLPRPSTGAFFEPSHARSRARSLVNQPRDIHDGSEQQYNNANPEKHDLNPELLGGLIYLSGPCEHYMPDAVLRRNLQ